MGKIIALANQKGGVGKQQRPLTSQLLSPRLKRKFLLWTQTPGKCLIRVGRGHQAGGMYYL